MTPEKIGNNYPQEFIARTRKLLQQYDEIVVNKLENEQKDKEIYNITLLINCFYGLLMMPAKLNRNLLPTDVTADNMLQEKHFSDVIKFTTAPQTDLSFKDFVNSIRNGLAHWEDERNSNPSRQELQISYEPKEGDQPFREIIIYGSTKKRDGIDTVVYFDISSEEKRKKILDFLELIYKPATV